MCGDESLSRWEGFSGAALARQWGLPAVHLFRRAGSTNDVARDLAARGAPGGTLVLAEEQLSGRGRGGRGWSSPPGLGVWLSLIVRPLAPHGLGVLPLVVGLAAARALDPFTRPARTQLKWPNDLLVEGRKLGGILCESAWESARPSFIVVGIGINVLHSPDVFPHELRPLATSVRIAAGWMPERVELAGAVVHAITKAVAQPLVLTGAAAGELEQRDALRGKEILVLESANEKVRLRGTALGIAPDGALLLRTADGVIRPIRSGTVRTAC